MTVPRIFFRKQFLFYTLLVILIFVSVSPRSIEVLNKNYLFLFDQGRDYQAVRSIVVDHKLTLIGAEVGAGSAGLSYIFHGPGYYYLLSISFLLTRGDPYGGVVTMWLFGIASIIFSYFFGNKIFGRFGGIVFALGVAISPPLIWQSRFVWNSYPSTLFILLVVYCVYQTTVTRKSSYWFLAAFFAGFIYNFELAISVPLCLAVLFYSAVIFRLRIVKDYILILVGYIFAFSPMILFETRHGFQGTKNIFSYLFSHHTTGAHQASLRFFLLDHLQSFLANISNTFPINPFVNFIPDAFFDVLILVAGIYILFQEKEHTKKRFTLFLISLPFIIFATFAFFRNTVWLYYLYALNVDYLLIFAFALMLSFQKRHLILSGLFCVVGCLLLLNGMMTSVTLFLHDYNDYGGFAKIKGKEAAIDYIYHDAKKQKFGLFIFSPPVYTYPYDYLLWWYASRKYGYQPYIEKKGIVYLLIETDYSKPWSYKGWLETVIKSGRVTSTTTLHPSGLIVQKRLFSKAN